MDDDLLSIRFSEYATSIKESLRISGVPNLFVGVFHFGEYVYSHHAAQDEVQIEHAGADKGPTKPELSNDETIYPGSCLFSLLRTCTVLRYAKDGVLDIDKPIRHYLQAFQERHDDIGRQATLRDLLMHRAGYPADKMWWESTTLSNAQTVQVAVHLSAVSSFRMYSEISQWNDFIVQTILETVTGRKFEDIFDDFFTIPLGIKVKTPSPLDKPNMAVAYEILGDGRFTPVKEEITRLQNSSQVYKLKNSLRQCIYTLCKLLTVYDRQHWSKLVITPGNPFVQLETLLGMIAKPLESPKLIHHQERTDGCHAVYFLIPETRSGVVCMSIAASPIGLCDILGHQLVDVLTGNHLEERSILRSVSEALEKQEALYANMDGNLSATGPISRPHKPLLLKFEGLYQNLERKMFLRIRHVGRGLRVTVDGSDKRQYDLRRVEEDRFIWLLKYSGDVLQGIEQDLIVSERAVRFEIEGSEVIALKWPINPGFPPEIFSRTTEALRGLYRPDLLSLPPELRNMVYIEALKTPTGSIYMVPNGQGYFFASDEMTSNGVVRPFNQIRNANKQLKQESRGLELTANDLVADGRHFDHFLRLNDIQLKACIRNVTLMGDFLSFYNPEEAILQRIIDFANTHSSATVHVRLFEMHFEDGRMLVTFMKMVYTIKKALRGNVPSPIDVSTEGLRRWERVQRSGTNMNVSNLRFFPRDAEFDEEEFREKLRTSILGKTISCDRLLAPHGGNPLALVDFVRGVYEIGI
ncbi:Beta-lactamase and DUF3471 domain protein [Pyrenophora teres f. teres]|uniref:Beta-lactamase and DUF3471 domain protein n=1 Tax=Pyrenophora teres f. teres TaxID=97479 RepID=A0A6S6VQY5_9PLEO|nr:Beta-lactamase and DUF3471 domain protein [Pyrenophora teres f. teres]